MNNVIFIEGVSGVGKTTITTLLCDKLLKTGYNADCYLEGANDNPLDPFNGTYPPPMPLTVFSETYIKCWNSFTKNQFEKDYVIFDGTLLHHQNNDLIRKYNVSDEVIVDHLSNLVYILAYLNPIIFYLSPSDVGQCLIQARKSREQSVPTEEQIAFWENRKRIDLYVIDRLSSESHILCIDDGWDSILDTMTKHIL